MKVDLAEFKYRTLLLTVRKTKENLNEIIANEVGSDAHLLADAQIASLLTSIGKLTDIQDIVDIGEMFNNMDKDYYPKHICQCKKEEAHDRKNQTISRISREGDGITPASR